MPVASFSCNHCFGANAVPWGLLGKKFRIFPFWTLYYPPRNGVLCFHVVVSTVSASTCAIHFWTLHGCSFLLIQPLLWCKRGTMGIGRAEVSQIYILVPILPPMKLGTMLPRSGKNGVCTDLGNTVLDSPCP